MEQTVPTPSKYRTGELSIADLRFTPPALPVPLLSETLLHAYDIKSAFKALSGERDQNFWVRTESGPDYLLKVASPVEDATLIDFQISALEYLADHDDDLPVPHMIRTRTGDLTVPIECEGENFSLRVLSFVPGTPLVNTGWVSTDVARGVGKLVGRVNRAFEGFSHPAETHFMPWDTLNGLLESCQLSKGYLPAHLLDACAPTIERLSTSSLPAMRGMPQSVIRNDAHAGNVLIEPDNRDRVCGLIDFGDMIAGPIVQDLATSLASLIEHAEDAPRRQVWKGAQPLAKIVLKGFDDAGAWRARLVRRSLQPPSQVLPDGLPVEPGLPRDRADT